MSLQEGELVKKEDLKRTVPQSQRAKLSNEIVGSPELRAGNIQSSKSPIRKSKTHKLGKPTQGGASVDTTGMYEDKCQSEKFEMNGTHKMDDEISDSKPVTNFCHGDVDSNSTTLPLYSPVEVCSGLCDSTPEPIRDNGDRVVSDADDELRGSTVSKTLDSFDAVEKPKLHDRNGHSRLSDEVKTRVLSPVGEEPTVGLAGSEVFEVSTGGHNLEEPFDKPADNVEKCGLDVQSMEHTALQLRFGTIDVIASDVQVPVNLKSSTTPNASALQRTVPDLQLPKREASENGHKSSGLSAPRIEEKEGGIATADIGATSEPVHDSSTRRSGLRSQSLPSGVCTPGIQHSCYQ